MFLLESFQILRLRCTREPSDLCRCHRDARHDRRLSSAVVSRTFVADIAASGPSDGLESLGNKRTAANSVTQVKARSGHRTTRLPTNSILNLPRLLEAGFEERLSGLAEPQQALIKIFLPACFHLSWQNPSLRPAHKLSKEIRSTASSKEPWETVSCALALLKCWIPRLLEIAICRRVRACIWQGDSNAKWVLLFQALGSMWSFA